MNKRTRSIVAIVLLIAFGIWLLFTFLPSSNEDIKTSPASNGGTTSDYEPKFKDEGDLYFIGAEGDTLKRLDIELAETDEEINYGMMFRKSMDENTGMLFLRNEERQQSFWMKNTYVSLDIIYINKLNEIVSIQRNAVPLSEQSLPSEGFADKILEVKGGYTEKYNLNKGTKILWNRN